MERQQRLILENYMPWEPFQKIIDLGFFVQHEGIPFSKDSGEFDIKTAWWLSEFSRLIYIDDMKLTREILDELVLKFEFTFFDSGGTQAGVFHNDEKIIIVFRGTELDKDEKFADVKSVADLVLKKHKDGGYVHRGIDEALDCVWDRLDAYVQSIRTNNHDVWITGHSMGAALATVCASRMPANGLYTFGSLRVGTKGFNKTVEKNTKWYRVAHARDIATRFPFPIVYRHGGECHFITLDGRILTNPGLWRMFYERIGGSEWKILYLLVRVIINRGYLTNVLLRYYVNHIHYNYAVHMWNNIEIDT